ncbi:MAG: hypothetical protein LW863_20285, partial [Flammeovirgaceae bacterium]|nr:hypothetical protein [Flammeovirgaceae bacterium]
MKTTILAIIFSISLTSELALALGRKIPGSPGNPNPPPSSGPPVVQPPVAKEPPAVLNPLTPADFNVFSEVAYPVGLAVDEVYKENKELIPQRDHSKAYRTDLCDINLENKNRFSDRIAYAVELKMQPSVAQLTYVASYFALPKNVKDYQMNSLISHPLCNVTAQTLNTTLDGHRVPSSAVIQKINRFTDQMNGYRRKILQGDRESYVQASQLWSKFFMCLSYMESLTTADTASSQRVAEKYAPAGYRRPAGVSFYEDPNQPKVSQLGIGLFQFGPNSDGDTQSCIREWNLLYPKCTISTTANASDMIRTVGSSLQTFNAFCAAAKVTGMFSVQLNTIAKFNTHPYNTLASGKLKPSSERCVSPHMNVNRSYNHFAPLQNGSGFTLGRVLSC